MHVAIFASNITIVSQTLSIFAVAFGVIGFVGGAVGYFAKGRSDAIIKAQAELIDVRDRQISDQKETIAAISSTSKVLAEQNETLRALAQGAPQLIKLTQEIKNLAAGFRKSHTRE